jgi:glycosyltransferase involved in cell wall biosynthesis
MTRRVLLLIKGLGRGGAEHIVASTAVLGDRSRFEYEVAYVVPAKHALVQDLQAHDVSIHCLGTGARTWRLRQLVRDRRIDVVHAHSPVVAVAARSLMAESVGFVYTEHNVWERYHDVTRWMNALTFARNDHVFAVSDEVRRSIQSSRFGRRCGGIETLVHGIVPDVIRRAAAVDGVRDDFGIERDAPLVVTVANFKPYKGHEHLLRAAELVHRSDPAVRFVIAGVGATQGQMQKLASDLHLDEIVGFAGFRDDIPRLVAAADAFVLPSEREGLPIALLEAMALSRPVVATTVGGIPEVATDGEDAILVPPADPQALADGIVTLLNDASLRVRLGRAAEVRAQAFDIRRAIARMEEVYEELAS